MARPPLVDGFTKYKDMHQIFLVFFLVIPMDITGKKQKKRHCGASILFHKKAPQTAKENLH